MSNGDVKEAKRMKKALEGIARAYARNKTQIDATAAMFGPGKKIKGAKVLKEVLTNPKVRKETLKTIGDYMKKNRNLMVRRQTREEAMEEMAKVAVVGSVGSGFIGKETTINKSKNKTKPKSKKKKFKSQY